MKISVIIPTHNRADILAKTLNGLALQTMPANQFEVIIVDDGSTDETPQTLNQVANHGKLQIKVRHQENTGQGIARNNGLKMAKAPVVLFLGDDMIPHENLLQEHWNSHEKFPKKRDVVLGLIEWHPDLAVNECMEWMVNGSSILGRFGGHQFAYEKLHNGQQPDFNFFYTSNLSLKRSFLGEEPFDVSFGQYGWEDIELGYRLQKEKNMAMHFNSHAITYHHHAMDEANLRHRMEKIGQSAHLLERKHPELRKIPRGFKKAAFEVLGNEFMLKILSRTSRPLYYYAVSKKHFLKGVKEGI